MTTPLAIPPTITPAPLADAVSMRTFSPILFNEIANLPEVRPSLGGEGPLELTPVLANPRNYAFQLGNAGGFIAMQVFGGSYEVHTLFRPGAAPAGMMKFAAESQNWMFTRTDCVELITRVPEGNKGADWLSARCGFAHIGQQKGWNGAGTTAAVKRLWIEDWAKRSDSAVAAGADFHARCEALGFEHSDEDNSTHNAIVGAALLMALRAQPLKAVNFYNHWAVVMGYPPVTLLSDAPLLVDMGENLLAWESEGRLELGCR